MRPACSSAVPFRPALSCAVACHRRPDLHLFQKWTPVAGECVEDWAVDDRLLATGLPAFRFQTGDCPARGVASGQLPLLASSLGPAVPTLRPRTLLLRGGGSLPPVSPAGPIRPVPFRRRKEASATGNACFTPGSSTLIEIGSVTIKLRCSLIHCVSLHCFSSRRTLSPYRAFSFLQGHIRWRDCHFALQESRFPPTSTRPARI